jgi:hypothetical protein
LNYRRKIILIASVLVIVNAFPVAGKDEMCDPLNNYESGAKGLRVGTWGGEHISLKATERGVEIEFDCAHAVINRRIVTDRRGRFDVSGTYVEEHGGPVREGERTGSYTVRFTGRITGETMTLTVRRGDAKESIGTFTLVYGREPELVKCR